MPDADFIEGVREDSRVIEMEHDLGVIHALTRLFTQSGHVAVVPLADTVVRNGSVDGIWDF